MFAHALGFERLIELVDRQMIGVHGDDVFRALGDDARKHADVAADVPRQVPVARAGDLANELTLLLGVRRFVMAALQVVGPRRLLRLPLEAGDERAKTLGVGLDDAFVEPGFVQILAHVARRALYAFCAFACR